MKYTSSWPIYNDKTINEVVDILKSGKTNQWFGNNVKQFETEFSKYMNCKYAVAVSNGTVALELALTALGDIKNSEIIVTPRSFIASAGCILIKEAIPIFADVDINSQNITCENIEMNITNKTKAIIIVHHAGWPCDMDKIMKIANKHNIYVIEDCAQAHGAKYKNKYVGTIGHIGAWSFCQDKIISTGGEGGMVTTNDINLYKKMWSYKDHGKNYDKMDFLSDKNKSINLGEKWYHDFIGTNFRMTEMQAVIGKISLTYLNEWVNQRRLYASIFNNKFKFLKSIILTIPNKNYYHSYYKYYFFINDCFLIDKYTRNDIIYKIHSEGIPVSKGSCGELYKEEVLNLNITLNNSKKLSDTAIMLLVDPSYSLIQIKEIADVIFNIIFEYTK
jgi:dTDP-4-amino-4,6-dideoxygalactose transaminase